MTDPVTPTPAPTPAPPAKSPAELAAEALVAQITPTLAPDVAALLDVYGLCLARWRGGRLDGWLAQARLGKRNEAAAFHAVLCAVDPTQKNLSKEWALLRAAWYTAGGDAVKVENLRANVSAIVAELVVIGEAVKAATVPE